MFLKLAADPEKQLASIEYWIMGSLNGVSKDSLAIPFFVTCSGFIIMTLLYRQILILSINEDEAAALGVNVTVLRFIILMIATLIVSSIICVTGLISFIGLIAPHIARLLTRRNDRFTYISSGLAGAIIMTLADIFARSVSSSELPVSIFTSLLGAPLLIILLIKANKKEVV
jgi:iron complex transport system permease protein